MALKSENEDLLSKVNALGGDIINLGEQLDRSEFKLSQEMEKSSQQAERLVEKENLILGNLKTMVALNEQTRLDRVRTNDLNDKCRGLAEQVEEEKAQGREGRKRLVGGARVEEVDVRRGVQLQRAKMRR